MKTSTITILNIIAFFLLAGGIYLSISSIIALPLLEDEASYKKEDFYAMNVDVDTLRNQSIRFIKEINLDSSTLYKYDSISVLIASQKRSETIKSYVSRAKKLMINNLVDQSDRCKQIYNTVRVLGKVRKDNYATELLLAYSQICTRSKQEVFNLIQAVDLQTANLFSIAIHDISSNRMLTRTEKASLNNLFSSVNPPLLVPPKTPEDSTTKFFIPASWSLKERSQNLAIITGLFGFALFGSVIRASNKINFRSLSREDIPTDGGISYEIIVFLVKGFSAALVVYLSLKGGLSLITTTNTDKVNPYLILFLCFISAVFSDSIWLWAKTKLVGDGEKLNLNSKDQAPIVQKQNDKMLEDPKNLDLLLSGRNDIRAAGSISQGNVRKESECPENKFAYSIVKTSAKILSFSLEGFTKENPGDSGEFTVCIDDATDDPKVTIIAMGRVDFPGGTATLQVTFLGKPLFTSPKSFTLLDHGILMFNEIVKLP